ncbi:NAD-dependent epimerase/dehydratase family protein [Glaciibacter flavus]|uniref:NAD-dependent epimerase/dehydratase family protein n=1 Tax=Orlajensenia flava TaxID=2565934 RepID=A0A4V3WUD7_9MICO|nr:NAD-dependent epimerase/dehydratase family protein [Glaciibacter flavus]THG35427.1 NAD-dependent epimerase/dehydratase family protein [Glaciibacter flavus]
MADRVLVLGGTGVISAAFVAEAVRRGSDVTVLNRGRASLRPVPDGVRSVRADLRDVEGVRSALGGEDYDVIAQFMAFTPEHVAADVELFSGRTGQYVFVSSASAYQTPPSRLPVTESTPLRNPFWQYSRDKIACEDVLVDAYRASGFPMTIVRPSHTYDATMLPTLGGWTDIARLRAGRPVVVHGDGTSLWTITHTRDVAVGLAGLAGNPLAIGEAFTVTGDHAPTWNQIYGWLADAAGVEAHLAHVTSDAIADAHPELGPGLLGDKAHSMVFDTAKLRALVPEFRTTTGYWEGAREAIAWYDEHPDHRVVDAELDAVFDRLVVSVER